MRATDTDGPPGKRSQPTNKTGEQRANRRFRRHTDGACDFAAVSAEILRGAIAAVTGKDFAIQFGKTKEGDTYVLRVVGDGDPYNVYVRPSEDIEAALIELQQYYAE